MGFYLFLTVRKIIQLIQLSAEWFPPKLRREKGFRLSPILLDVLEVLASTIKVRKGNKSHTDGKGRNTLPLFADGMVVYLENPK